MAEVQRKKKTLLPQRGGVRKENFEIRISKFEMVELCVSAVSVLLGGGEPQKGWYKMKEYRGGMWGPPGYYFEKKSWKTLAVPKPGRILEGTEKSTYIYVPIPPLLMALLGPLAGALYVVLFPLIGALVLIWVSATKLWKITAVAVNRRALRSKGDGSKPLRP